jgi:hypothetical protein
MTLVVYLKEKEVQTQTMDFNICVKEVLFKIFECYVIVITGHSNILS